jgi:hypothetical protein
MRVSLFVFLGLILGLSVTAGAAKRARIDSHWPDREIAIDGDSGDWTGPLAPLDGKHPINAAVANDGQSLYLVLSTSDATVRRQIMRQGLTVWFDPSGGQKKHFGIKFPVGFTPDAGGRDGLGGRGRRGGPGGFGRPRGAGEGDVPGVTEGSRDGPDQAEPSTRLEVYGPAKDDAHNFTADAAPGIAVKVGQVEGYVVYELKVPLARTSETPYAIEANPGSAIGLGLETQKFERPQRMGGFGGSGGGMGGRGGGIGRRGGGTGDRRNGAFEVPKPLKVWATIQLAAH